MHEMIPRVRLVASTTLDENAIKDYLENIGADDSQLYQTVTLHPEDLIEFAGRMCYKSWKPEMNPNVTKIRTDKRLYFQNILDSGHGSILEHVNFTFLFQDVSRVFTHELVRHRAGTAISQESLRYVRLDDIGFRIPGVLEKSRESIIDIVERIEDLQIKMAEEASLDEPGTSFAVKKEITSAMRRIAPMGLSTNILWTANLRTLRFVIPLRTAVAAEEEMRTVFTEVGKICIEKAPLVFQDFQQSLSGHWSPRYRKV